MKCPKCGKETLLSRDMGEYTISRWHLTHFVCPEHGIVKSVERWLYTWDEIKPDDAGDFIEVFPGAFQRR